jgi:hypothetical protein
MQSIKKLAKTLEKLSAPEYYLFSASDFYQIISLENLKVLLGRAVQSELLVRICKGIYISIPKVWTLQGKPCLKGCRYRSFRRLQD